MTVHKGKRSERIYEIGLEKLVFKLTAADTNGQYSQIERTVAPMFKSPPQFHAQKDTDWSCYLIEGELEFYFEDETVKLKPRETIYVPRNTFFRWANPLNSSALILITYTPGGFEEFYTEIAEIKTSSTGRIDNYEETLQSILKIQDKYGMYRKE